MLTRLIHFLFGPRQKNEVVAHLESEISFLREQVKSLQETILRLTEKPKAKVSSLDEMRPKVFDPETGRFRPKTDEEINQDMLGLKELGIL